MNEEEVGEVTVGPGVLGPVTVVIVGSAPLTARFKLAAAAWIKK